MPAVFFVVRQFVASLNFVFISTMHITPLSGMRHVDSVSGLDAQNVIINLAERSYPIAIGAGLLATPATYAALPKAAAALIVTNTTVAPLYADALRTALAPKYAQVHLVVLPDGEEHKNWPTLNLIFDALL